MTSLDQPDVTSRTRDASAAHSERVVQLRPLLLHLGVEVAVDGLVGPALAEERGATLLLRRPDHVRDGLWGGMGGGVQKGAGRGTGTRYPRGERRASPGLNFLLAHLL